MNKYFIGDPCYTLVHSDARDEKAWSDACGTVDWNSTDCRMEYKDERLHFEAVQTAYGDGTYHDQNGNEYGVDSGSLGFARIDHLNEEKIKSLKECGLIVELEEAPKVVKIDTLIKIGDIQIETGFIDEEEDDEWEEDEDDYFIEEEEEENQ